MFISTSFSLYFALFIIYMTKMKISISITIIAIVGLVFWGLAARQDSEHAQTCTNPDIESAETLVRESYEKKMSQNPNLVKSKVWVDTNFESLDFIKISRMANATNVYFGQNEEPTISATIYADCVIEWRVP